MKPSFITTTSLSVCALMALATPGNPAHASLMLFPGGGASEVIDGGPGDATGVANDMIVIDPNNPIDVPGHPGLVFSGMVQHAVGGTLTVGQAQGIRALKITSIPAGSGLPGAGSPAILHNTTLNPITISVPIVWVSYDYPIFNPAQDGAATVGIAFEGTLDTGGMSPVLSVTNQELSLSVASDTWWPAQAFTPFWPITASWSNPGTNAAPQLITGYNDDFGDYDNFAAGQLRISIESLTLGPDERFEFPASVTAGLIPEPASAAILLVAGSALIFRRQSAS